MLATGGRSSQKFLSDIPKFFPDFALFFLNMKKKFPDIPKKSFRIYDIFPGNAKNFSLIT